MQTETLTEDDKSYLEKNRPSNFKIISDVMGFDAFTYLRKFSIFLCMYETSISVAFLLPLSTVVVMIVIVGVVNLGLGEGWLGALLGYDNQPISPPEVSFSLPEGYTKPPLEEIMKNIPESDLKVKFTVLFCYGISI
jgi:hypothetical protein